MEIGLSSSKTDMSRANEKFTLITKIMDSYMMESPNMPNKEWWDKLDKLSDMELETLKYLAELRKIKKIETFVEY